MIHTLICHQNCKQPRANSFLRVVQKEDINTCPIGTFLKRTTWELFYIPPHLIYETLGPICNFKTALDRCRIFVEGK